MATATFMDTFNTENGTDTTTFTKEQLAEWAQNAAAAGAKNSQTTDSDSNSEAGSKPIRKQRKTKNKQSRGENQPKRPMSGYMLFLNENRAAIKAELLKDSEKVSVGDIAKVGGAQWKALGDNEKAKFTEQAEQLKSEYAKAMETWCTEHPEEAAAPKAKKAPKKAAAPINLDEAPEAPHGFTGPFAGYLAKTVKNEDGKYQFKDFAEAISAAMELGDNCGGVTRTTHGWSLRKAITPSNEYGDDGARKEISYIKSQFVNEELAATVVSTEHPEETAAPKETKTKKAKTTKTPAAPVNLDEAHEAPHGFSGPFAGHLSKIIKTEDGKSQFKDFQEALTAAMELGDNCGGVTRTTHGWSLHKEVTLTTNGPADKKEISFTKFQFVSEELSATVVTIETVPVAVEEAGGKTDEETEVEPVEEAGGKTDEETDVEHVEPVEEAGGKTDEETKEPEEEQYSEDEVETISWEFKGKDYELEEATGKVYTKDENGEYYLVGYRKVREVEVMTRKGKKTKKEVYIDEPWKN